MPALVCPRCGSQIVRIHRRTSDRIMSIFISVRRYSCQSSNCQWEGKIRVTSLLV